MQVGLLDRLLGTRGDLLVLSGIYVVYDSFYFVY